MIDFGEPADHGPQRLRRALSGDAVGGRPQHYAKLLAPFGLDAKDPTFWDGGLSVQRVLN